jgi:hypothetical protein
VLCESSLLTLLGPALILDHRLFKERAAMRMRAARPNVGPRVCKFITLEVASLSRAFVWVLVRSYVSASAEPALAVCPGCSVLLRLRMRSRTVTAIFVTWTLG